MHKQKANKVYYNSTVRNIGVPPTFKEGRILAKSDVTRSQPIISNPGDYYMTIDRFRIDGADIPLTIFEIETGFPPPPDPLPPALVNKTFINFTLSHTGTDFTENVVYVGDNDLPVPTRNSEVNASNRYYWVYSYAHSAELFNTALALAITALNAAKGTAFTPPFFIYDTELRAYTLIIPFDFIAGGVEMFVNGGSGEWFTSFPIDLHEGTELKFFEFKIFFNQQNGFKQFGVAETNPPLLLEFPMEYSDMFVFSPFRSIIFTTGSIPTTSEWVQNKAFGGGNSSAKILIDFQPAIDKAGDTRSIFTYFPQGPYRLIDLWGDEPLYRIDYQIFWKDWSETLHPLELPLYSTAEVKFAFFRKSTFTS